MTTGCPPSRSALTSAMLPAVIGEVPQAGVAQGDAAGAQAQAKLGRGSDASSWQAGAATVSPRQYVWRALVVRALPTGLAVVLVIWCSQGSSRRERTHPAQRRPTAQARAGVASCEQEYFDPGDAWRRPPTRRPAGQPGPPAGCPGRCVRVVDVLLRRVGHGRSDH
ncbi:MAG: hypothetical protein WKF73_18445 [Nocardioidaceae bacterium]